ncbi:MAG TPA: helix-turn-helix domain-containing protein [Candidatus Binatia bacterium]|nr:helix-turn-helix domain-containing protein [Candidatus Binatia bacterium]
MELSAIHVLHGAVEDVQKYVRALKQLPSVLQLEGAGNIFFSRVEESMHPEEYRAVYNPELLYVSPIINDSDGFETWHVASWNRAPLERLIQLSKSSSIVMSFELLEFSNRVIDDVYVANLFPKLPPKQREALYLAYDNGYYSFPKQTDLSELTQIMGVSKATFQEHLRRAESKIIPFILKRS